MTEGPLHRYERDLEKPGFQTDESQRRAVEHLQRLFVDLQAPLPSGWRRLFGGLQKEVSPIRGLYLWGGVGRGKTYLMDMFFEALPFSRKMRTHFHRFMRRVHSELTRLKGEKNPLEKVADVLAGEARVICFDEFFVADITDAMILANLLKALFARGVTLVATSNVEPVNLYKDGLQRERFLPAIDLLRENMVIVNVDGGADYRLRALVKAELYHSPLGDAAEEALQACFLRLVPDSRAIRRDLDLMVEGRTIQALREADDVVWFDFKALCDGPRSQHDYIVLAKEYHAVLVANVPELGQRNDDQARRFIYLVDEFYDRRVKLVLSAAKPLNSLYVDGRLGFEFQRTVSRLLEMQSQEYLALPHKP
jgi:cell division protein ZapE